MQSMIEFYNKTQLAKKEGVSVPTVHEWAKAGILVQVSVSPRLFMSLEHSAAILYGLAALRKANYLPVESSARFARVEFGELGLLAGVTAEAEFGPPTPKKKKGGAKRKRNTKNLKNSQPTEDGA